MAIYQEINRETLLKLKYGDIIKYKDGPIPTYLIVEKVNVKTGKISGNMASPIGINSISIDDLLTKGDLDIVKL